MRAACLQTARARGWSDGCRGSLSPPSCLWCCHRLCRCKCMYAYISVCSSLFAATACVCVHMYVCIYECICSSLNPPLPTPSPFLSQTPVSGEVARHGMQVAPRELLTHREQGFCSSHFTCQCLLASKKEYMYICTHAHLHICKSKCTHSVHEC